MPGKSQHPAFVVTHLHDDGVDGFIKQRPIALVREQSWYAPIQRLRTLALKHVRGLRTRGIDHVELGQLVVHQAAAKPLIGAVSGRQRGQLLPHVGNQGGIFRVGGADQLAMAEQCVEMGVDALQRPGVGIRQDETFHVRGHPLFEKFGRIVIRLLQHEIGLQGLVQVFDVIDRWAAQQVLQALRHQRLQAVFEHPLIGGSRRRLDTSALIEAGTVVEWWGMQ